MKKTLIFLILLFFIAKGFSQKIPSTSFSKEDYLEKSKRQKTTAWVLLSAGIGLSVVGIIGFETNNESFNDNSTNTYGALIVSGSLIALGSIPFFISSGSNSRKAATLSISNQPILFPRQDSYVLNLQPSLSLKVNF